VIRSLDGKTPKIHPSCFVSETAYIVGDVEIGEDTSIWPGAVIRGDYGKIIIGKACSIQDNCVLHTDDYLELGDNVLMTHGAVIHGGIVGNNVLIGMNAFITSAPSGPLDPSTALPTQIFIWFDSPERGFVARTSAAICVLLAFLSTGKDAGLRQLLVDARERKARILMIGGLELKHPSLILVLYQLVI